jgi:hypothetical protein
MMSLGIRLLGYVTILASLFVGSLTVRILVPQQTVLLFDTRYLESIKDIRISPAAEEKISSPEMAFHEITIPVFAPAKKAVAGTVAPEQKISPDVPRVVVAPETVSDYELPFHEVVTIDAVHFHNEIVVSHESLFSGLKPDVLVASATSVVEDKVETKLAQAEKKGDQAEDEELDDFFFEYASSAPQAQVKSVSPETKKDMTTQPETTQTVSESAPQENDEASGKMFYDYPSNPELQGTSAPVISAGNLKSIQQNEKNTPSPEKAEEVSINDMIAFDYSGAQKGIQANLVPTVSSVTTHPRPGKSSKHPKSSKNKNQKRGKAEGLVPESNSLVSGFAPIHQTARTIVQVTSTDFEKPQIETNFELRFNDDSSDIHEDFGGGAVTLEDELYQPRMTRSVTVIKRGFIPTNNDLILEKGETTLSLPVIEERAFNSLMEPFGNRGFIGAVLVELDDKTEDVDLDVSYGKALTLDGDMKITSKSDYRYKLFVGVRAGNALLMYRHVNRQKVSKIIHVHEHEVTFDANVYDNLQRLRVVLEEEELLASGQSALTTSAERVRVFATNKTAKKINQNTYELDFGMGLLGERNYIELNHQDEPIFIGFRQNKKVQIPSENFMRHVISNLQGRDISNRCIVQINLAKGLDKVVVGSESVNQTLETQTQMLDQDGKFYDSPSDKTKKIIIIGEAQGSDDNSRDARINIKLNYVDGSVEYLGSYCSPNSYLVEQL